MLFLCAGIATSLKVLFSDADCQGVPSAQPTLVLERNEVIAMINLLERLSKSIELVRVMSAQILSGDEGLPATHKVGSIQSLTHPPF